MITQLVAPLVRIGGNGTRLSEGEGAHVRRGRGALDLGRELSSGMPSLVVERLCRGRRKGGLEVVAIELGGQGLCDGGA